MVESETLRIYFRCLCGVIFERKKQMEKARDPLLRCVFGGLGGRKHPRPRLERNSGAGLGDLSSLGLEAAACPPRSSEQAARALCWPLPRTRLPFEVPPRCA